MLALGGCGGGEPETGKAPAPNTGAGSPTAVPGAAAGTDEFAGTELEGFTPSMPFEVPIEGPIEYEEAQDKPLAAAFPTFPEQPRPDVKNLPGDDSVLGRPLVINGKVVPFEEIKKQICLGSFGAAELQDARIEIYIAEEQRRLRDIGAPPDRIDLAKDELEDYLSVVEESVKSEYPDGGISMEDLYKGLSTNDPKKKLHTQLLFTKLYMPDDPDLFPPLSVEAILKDEGGQSLLDHYKERFEVMKATEGPYVKDSGELQFDGIVMQQIVSHLNDSAAVARDPGEGILMRVNGVDIRTDDIWDRIRQRVTTMEVLAAKQWIVNNTLIREALTKAEAWLGDEEADAAYFAHVDPYRNSFFSLERVAVAVKGFPSVEYFRQYRRLFDSFARHKTPTAEELAQHAEYRINKVVGQVSVDVDLILCSAYDFKTGTWKENGWVEASNRMKDVLNLLVEEQRPWEELVERYSDFYSPPVPVSQRAFSDPDPNKKGRYRNIQRNILIGKLGESEFRTFLNGYAITDFIFFDQGVGTLGDPMIGPHGWYLPRLLRRSKAPLRIPIDQPTMDTLIHDDFLATQLNAFAQELIKKNEVYGLELPGT